MRAQRPQNDVTRAARAEDSRSPAQNRQARNSSIDSRGNREQETAAWSHSASERTPLAFGEQMAIASRRARETHSRRAYEMPALVSSRGREANRRYLDSPASNPPRIIDEVV